MNEHLTDFQQRAAALAIKTMFNKPYFDICVVRDIAKMFGRENQLGGRDYEALHTLHCVNWANMDHTLRQQVHDKVLEVLGLTEAYFVERVDPEPKPTAKRRLPWW